MTTIKGFLRSANASQRRYERESKHKQRELERQQNQFEKMQEFERATYEVAVYENLIDVLTSVHKDVGPTWDWQHILDSTARPSEPNRVNFTIWEQSARERLNNYKPSIVEKTFRKPQAKIASLEADIAKAVSKDEAEYQQAYQEYQDEYEQWKNTKDLAERIIARDVNAYLEAISEIAPFQEIPEIGAGLNFSIDDELNDLLMEVDLRVRDESTIPKEVKSLLKSGKLSTKVMPKTKYFALYQDYICGCVLRVARELFVLLPLEIVIVTAIGNVLNTKTGHIEEKPILSIAIPRATLNSLNFDSLDPSDSMSNFIHKMSFKPTAGFSAIEKLKASDIEQS